MSRPIRRLARLPIALLVVALVACAAPPQPPTSSGPMA
jgi:hypothetical protein